jgi:RNA-directed DNA polymerase
MSKAKHQMPTPVGRASAAHGEAGCDLASDEACDPLAEHPDTGLAMLKACTGGLLEATLTRENLQAAWKRVKANKGAAGADGDASTLMTASSRTARCGPARRVVWQGRSR